MLIDHDWEPGVWINGRRSDDPTDTDAFGAFAHSAHTDLITARDTGDLPAHVEITVGATTLSTLWNDTDPSTMLLTVRFNGLAGTAGHPIRRHIAEITLGILDRRGTEHLPIHLHRHYAGALVFGDETGSRDGPWFPHNLHRRAKPEPILKVTGTNGGQ
ncbi:hypothetical protein [Saccharothrix variisporea]|uniref:Uncharacterized protein n=1 Tax=Saccharothrix variisporea TaxID=543527 RepID=A0A495X6G6_9PSEU|nr:hypothetical protein [Saccharothrix variisporea]RKT69487.1 hypothetical protein DFJ66_2717 [Saccharothrix variisporea]